MNRSRNNPNQNKLIPLIIVLLFAVPQFVIPILILWGIVKVVKITAAQSSQKSPSSGASASRCSTRQEKFDDCPQPLFCFHKDKGEHHVRKGKERDPWDRPDIDISKYQRNR